MPPASQPARQIDKYPLKRTHTCTCASSYTTFLTLFFSLAVYFLSTREQTHNTVMFTYTPVPQTDDFVDLLQVWLAVATVCSPSAAPPSLRLHRPSSKVCARPLQSSDVQWCAGDHIRQIVTECQLHHILGRSVLELKKRQKYNTFMLSAVANWFGGRLWRGKKSRGRERACVWNLKIVCYAVAGFTSVLRSPWLVQHKCERLSWLPFS